MLLIKGSACFINAVRDDLMSIFELVKTERPSRFVPTIPQILDETRFVSGRKLTQRCVAGQSSWARHAPREFHPRVNATGTTE